MKTAFPARRAKIDITVEDPRPAAEIRQLIAKALEATPGVLSNPAPRITLASLKGDTARFSIQIWSDEPAAARDRALTALGKVFDPGKAEITADQG